MTFRDDDIALLHMRDHAEKILELLAGRQKEEVLNDWVTTMAASRLFEILGEAATRLSTDTRDQYPDIPWRDIIDMRNRLIHGYDTIDMNVVWRTANDDIPYLLKRLDEILEERTGD
jgi:uncharacterized protein with HEPN domain